MTSYQNESGEYLMTAAEVRFEAELDAQYDAERAGYEQESRGGCGDTGCEYHDGECADNWGEGDDASDPYGPEDAGMYYNFGME